MFVTDEVTAGCGEEVGSSVDCGSEVCSKMLVKNTVGYLKVQQAFVHQLRRKKPEISGSVKSN